MSHAPRPPLFTPGAGVVTRLLLVWALPLTLACPPAPGSTDAGKPTPPDGSAQEPDAGQSPDAGFRDPRLPRGAEATDALCGNTLDDDGNGYANCDDYWCRDSVNVTVCGSLENTVDACTDGVDNPETPGNAGQPKLDGLVDCADPDCLKNPALGVCPPLRWELDGACGDGQDNDQDGSTDCDDPDCLHAGTSPCPRGAVKRVLFDDAHRERAGSADWVVDTAGPHPWPSRPSREGEWAGNLSSLGRDLLLTGRFVVETLTADGRLSHGTSSRQDLSAHDVLVLPEPSAPLEPDEADAVVAFVRAGGGLLVVVDHLESDRDGNGWDSVQVVNAVLERAGGGELARNPFGFSVALLGYQASGQVQGMNQGRATTIPPDVATHPVLDGPHGKVEALGMYRGGLFTLQPAGNDAVTVLVHALPLGTAGYAEGSPYVLAAQVGQGRVVAVGDSAIMNDGTDSHGIADNRYDSYHDVEEDNAALFLNAVEWLAP